MVNKTLLSPKLLKGIPSILYSLKELSSNLINFFDDNSGKAKRIAIQVKSGHVTAAQIRDLVGVIQREKAVIGVFITLEKPTRPMLSEAASQSFYEPEHFPGHKFPRLQILTIEELLQGIKQVEYPRLAPTATFRRAERKRRGPDPQQELL